VLIYSFNLSVLPNICFKRFCLHGLCCSIAVLLCSVNEWWRWWWW